MRTRLAVVLCGFTAFSGSVHAQPVTRLTKPDVEFAAELSSIAGVHERSDGRVIVLDRKEKRILALDAAGGATSVAREGSGPGEYLQPTALIALPGDTTLIEDGGNRRFLVIGPDRKATGVLPMVTLKPSEGVTYTVTPRGVDRQGRFYVLTPTGLAPNERIPILRYDRRREKFDTIGSVLNERFGAARGQPQARVGGASFGMISPTPWGVKDEWAVLGDGSVAIVHNEPYSLDWVSAAGAATRGKPISYEAVRVTEAERQLWRKQQLDRAGTLTTTDASGNKQVRKIPVPEPTSWPERLPAFSGQASVVGAADGTVWIRRLGPASAKHASYDVLDRTGAVIERVELPLNESVIGFGRGAVYVVRVDDDGLQYLRRYKR